MSQSRYPTIMKWSTAHTPKSAKMRIPHGSLNGEKHIETTAVIQNTCFRMKLDSFEEL